MSRLSQRRSSKRNTNVGVGGGVGVDSQQGPSSSSSFVVDPVYEFNAPKFYDFQAKKKKISPSEEEEEGDDGQLQDNWFGKNNSK